jgi:hypothetical protein
MLKINVLNESYIQCSDYKYCDVITSPLKGLLQDGSRKFEDRRGKFEVESLKIEVASLKWQV